MKCDNLSSWKIFGSTAIYTHSSKQHIQFHVTQGREITHPIYVIYGYVIQQTKQGILKRENTLVFQLVNVP